MCGPGAVDNAWTVSTGALGAGAVQKARQADVTRLCADQYVGLVGLPARRWRLSRESCACPVFRPGGRRGAPTRRGGLALA